MKNIFLAAMLAATVSTAQAQQFVTDAVIEYEVKTNIKKTLGNGNWAEMMKDNLNSDFKTGYYTLSFKNNKSLFRFDHWEANSKVPQFLRQSDEENSWYADYNTGKTILQKNVAGSNFNIDDSLRAIHWKLSGETRIIAGYNCRKATGVILDSVYVFAFYTDEITLPGGPCTINGLPGTILGLTIPRMYTSYIATKITIGTADEKNIKPATAKKYLSFNGLKTTLKERTKDWASDDDEDSKQYIAQLYWQTLL